MFGTVHYHRAMEHDMYDELCIGLLVANRIKSDVGKAPLQDRIDLRMGQL